MKPTRCPTCKRLMRRSTQANSRYWLLIHQIAQTLKPQGHVFSPESWHTWLKTRFLGADDVVLPSGKTLVIPRSSADLDAAEFATYMEQVEAWANEHDVYLEGMPA